jgi:hypothetical protein
MHHKALQETVGAAVLAGVAAADAARRVHLFRSPDQGEISAAVQRPVDLPARGRSRNRPTLLVGHLP